MVAHLLNVGRHQQMQSIGPQQMIQACAKGDISTVQQLIKMKKDTYLCKGYSLHFTVCFNVFFLYFA
jgi:ATP-dependent exoDNAse (exonuclease V) alpha subunit